MESSKKKKKKRSSKKEAEEEGGKEEPSLIDIAEGEEEPSASLSAKTEPPRKKSPVRETKKQGDVDKHVSLRYSRTDDVKLTIVD